jgi:predicted ATP-grasp superfamily ATP-dependent carboligase
MVTKELKEGILVGVTSALLLKNNFPITALFAETHSELPDSKASAQIIQVLNKYLNLDVDTKPLLEQAKRFEDKLNTIIRQGANVQSQIKKKQLNYVG